MGASPSASPSASASASPSASPSATPSTPYYTSDSVVSGIARAGIGFITQSASYTVVEVPQTADVIHMVKVPAGATVLDVCLDVTDLDSGTDMTLSVGYTGALEAFISQSTIGQAGGIARLSVPGGTLKYFSAEDTIQVSVTLGGAGVASGTIKLTVYYSMDP